MSDSSSTAATKYSVWSDDSLTDQQGRVLIDLETAYTQLLSYLATVEKDAARATKQLKAGFAIWSNPINVQTVERVSEYQTKMTMLASMAIMLGVDKEKVNAVCREA
jgi:hypothetical protein